MTKYYLLLDESGDFIQDIDGKEVPSIVGGLLFSPEKGLTLTKIGEIFERLCNNHGIDSRHFHSTDLPKVLFSRFTLDLLSDLKENGATYVVFENVERINIVNATTTYINILSEGLIQLFQTLSTIEESVEFEIIAARRMEQVNDENGKSYLRRITVEEYQLRLEEKLAIGLARRNLASSIHNWKWSFSLGSARNDDHLKVADTICHAYFRQKKKFTPDQQVMLLHLLEEGHLYTLFDHESSISIKRLLSNGMLGMALFEWVVAERFSNRVDQSRFQENEFLDLILTRLQKLPRHSLKAELQVFLTTLQSLNHVERNFTKAEETLKKVTIALIPNMKERGIAAHSFYLDSYLSLFTTATHQGHIKLAEEQISNIQQVLPELGKKWESYDYVIDFMLREAVHDLNKYDFERVIENMTKLEEFITQMLSILPIAGEIPYFQQDDLYSDLLGKTLGNRLQAYFMKAVNSSTSIEDYEHAIRDSGLALEQFKEEHHAHRQFQYRAQIECNRGNLESSYEYLCRSYSLPSTTSYAEFLRTILEQPKSSFLFGLMHFTRLMAASSEVHQHADDMYKAIISTDVLKHPTMTSEESFHPMQIIHWKIASYLSKSASYSAAQTYYQKAIAICNDDPECLTLRSIGLGIACEQASFLLTGGTRVQKEAKHALKLAIRLYEQFMEEAIPSSMRDYFERWKQEITMLERYTDNEKSRVLYSLSTKIPY
ncbi:hypothetical protein E1I69_11465 [Bacillus timonensis]|uniref:DUF3800 domain-containing protein n=1 Tax=Bacillus timonensis TaxID=1033734 RepID=A0A4V3V7Q0_9BACI|nr:hypothetical protein [Bacillus timonensis]THE12313.1 hypothetical protein E1I69_11465 [Bacillus timonensis]